MTGCEVLHFDLLNEDNQKLSKLLKTASQKAGKEAHKQGIFTRRPNEAGNHIEPFVISALRKVGLKADRPRTKSGKIKVAGYPDIEIMDKQGRVIYLDCKTFNTTTKNQSFRSFYFSPSTDPKINKNAFHMLLSFELTNKEKDGKRAFVPISWQLYTLEKLKVHIKHEFNASNRDLYRPEFLLARGRIK